MWNRRRQNLKGATLEETREHATPRCRKVKQVYRWDYGLLATTFDCVYVPHQAQCQPVRDYDNVQVVPRDALIGEVSEHGGNEGRGPVVHVQSGFTLRKPARQESN